MAKKDSPFAAIAKKSAADLRKSLAEARAELMKLRLLTRSHAEKGTHKVRATRKTIARILTALRAAERPA